MICTGLCKSWPLVVMTAAFVVGPASAETVVVKPSTMQVTGWKTATKQGTRNAGGYEFVAGPGSVPAGSGSLHLWVGSGESDPLSKAYFGTNKFTGIRLDKITQFKLSVCPRWWDYAGAQPVMVELAVAIKKNRLRLCSYYPWGFKPSGYYGKMKWREYDLMNVGGAWETTNTDQPNKYGNWAWLVKLYPDGRITTPDATDWPQGTLCGMGLNIKIGAGKAMDRDHTTWWRESSGCNAYVDKLTVGYTDADGHEIVTTYDFEVE